MRISRQQSLIQSTTEQELENVKCFNYLDSVITNDARCTREIKYSTVKAKAAFNKTTLFTSKLDLNLRKNTSKCYTWSTALHGAATWTLREVDQK